MISIKVNNITLECETKPDLFSPKGLDSGSRLLLDNVLKSTNNYESVIDWGSGWGAIGLVLAKNKPSSRVLAIDSDIAAVACTQSNIELNNLGNIRVVASHGYDQIEDDTRFDLVVSNPPTHRGREVVERFISESYERLTIEGNMFVVVESRLKPWVFRKMKEVFSECRIVDRGSKHVVLSSTKMVQ